MSDEAVDLRGGVTLNQLIAKLEEEEVRDAQDWHGKLSLGDLPMEFEGRHLEILRIVDVWLAWEDAETETETPSFWKVELR